MALKCQSLERNGIEDKTFECILIPRHYKEFKSYFLDSVFFRFLMGFELRGTGVSFALILVLAIVTWRRWCSFSLF